MAVTKKLPAKYIKHSLVGMYLHTFKDGELNWQGHIIGTDGADVIVQLYSWESCGPTSAVLIPRADLYDQAKVILYAELEDWHRGAQKIQEREHREHERKRRQQVDEFKHLREKHQT